MKPRINKYGAKKSHCSAGHEHDSRREAKRCNDLRILVMAGEITDLEIEPQYWFEINGAVIKHTNGRRVGYKPDFGYRERDGRSIVEDSKGFAARDFPLRCAIFRALFPDIELRIV